jgi:septal ring-binding cell division protein DamX
MLQACASTRISEQLQSGKISFEDGNFKSAFHKLLPLACEGNAEAEYAIGYMYYYGYGTAQDEESGIFWMKKAAEQHYQPAIQALSIIKQNKVSEEPTQQLSAERSIKEDSAKVLQALAENQSTDLSRARDEEDLAALAQSLPPAKPEIVDPLNARPIKQLAVTENDKVMMQLPPPASQIGDSKNSKTAKSFVAAKPVSDFNEERKKNYTLQLMGSYNLADIKQTQDHLQLTSKSYCARTQRHGRSWYVLAYGKYTAPYLAKLAIDDLPRNLRDMKPWVRELDGVDIVA